MGAIRLEECPNVTNSLCPFIYAAGSVHTLYLPVELIFCVHCRQYFLLCPPDPRLQNDFRRSRDVAWATGGRVRAEPHSSDRDGWYPVAYLSYVRKIIP